MIKYNNNKKFVNKFYAYLDSNMNTLYSGNYDNVVKNLVDEFIDTRFEDVLTRIYPNYIVSDILRRDNYRVLTSMAFEYLDPVFMSIVA